jgi:hypothetical protein
MFFIQHTPLQPEMLYLLLVAVRQISSEGQANHKKADCIVIISDGWLNFCGQGIINYIISTPQPVFYKSTDTRDNRHTGLYCTLQMS